MYTNLGFMFIYALSTNYTQTNVDCKLTVKDMGRNCMASWTKQQQSRERNDNEVERNGRNYRTSRNE